MVNGLVNSGEKSAQVLALNLVRKWVKTNYVAFSQTNGTMFEKYDAEKVTKTKLLQYSMNDIKIVLKFLKYNA